MSIFFLTNIHKNAGHDTATVFTSLQILVDFFPRRQSSLNYKGIQCKKVQCKKKRWLTQMRKITKTVYQQRALNKGTGACTHNGPNRYMPPNLLLLQNPWETSKNTMSWKEGQHEPNGMWLEVEVSMGRCTNVYVLFPGQDNMLVSYLSLLKGHRIKDTLEATVYLGPRSWFPNTLFNK